MYQGKGVKENVLCKMQMKHKILIKRTFNTSAADENIMVKKKLREFSTFAKMFSTLSQNKSFKLIDLINIFFHNCFPKLPSL